MAPDDIDERRFYIPLLADVSRGLKFKLGGCRKKSPEYAKTARELEAVLWSIRRLIVPGDFPPSPLPAPEPLDFVPITTEQRLKALQAKYLQQAGQSASWSVREEASAYAAALAEALEAMRDE